MKNTTVFEHSYKGLWTFQKYEGVRTFIKKVNISYETYKGVHDNPPARVQASTKGALHHSSGEQVAHFLITRW